MAGNPQVVLESSDPQSEAATRLLQAMRAETLNRYQDVISASVPPPRSEPLGPRSTLFLAWLGGQAVGCAALHPMDDGAAEVRRVYVAPLLRRRGIARRLLTALEQLASQHGYDILRLETGTRQPEAIALYESQGFRCIPAYGCHVGDPLSICFEKRLTQDQSILSTPADRPRMANITLRLVGELKPQVERVLSRVSAQLGALLPGLEVHHIGATAIPGAVTKGDVDVLLRVAPGRFQAAVGVLKQHFSIRQPVNWTAEFASFGDDTGYELPLGIQVAVKDSSADFLLYLRDYLIAHPDALAEYNRLKTGHAAEGTERYWKAKDAFLAKLLAAR